MMDFGLFSDLIQKNKEISTKFGIKSICCRMKLVTDREDGKGWDTQYLSNFHQGLLSGLPGPWWWHNLRKSITTYAENNQVKDRLSKFSYTYLELQGEYLWQCWAITDFEAIRSSLTHCGDYSQRQEPDKSYTLS